MMPDRIQRKRERGWQKPAGAKYVGCLGKNNPGKWGNPYNECRDMYTAEERVALYRRDLFAGLLPVTVDDIVRELKGKDLMCWCKPGEPCHADVLIEIANTANLVTR